MKRNKISRYMVASFMSNVNKCDKFVHKQTHAESFGTVRLVKAAYENNGKRKFAVSNSTLIKSGSYSYAGLRMAYESAI